MRCPRPDGAQHRPAGILFRLVWLPPMGKFLSFLPPVAHFSQQLEKWAKEPPETNDLWTSFTLKSFIRYGT